MQGSAIQVQKGLQERTTNDEEYGFKGVDSCNKDVRNLNHKTLEANYTRGLQHDK